MNTKLTITLIVMATLSGCAGNDSKNGTLPPILMYPNNLSKVIVLQGMESGLTWDKLSYKITGDDPTCAIKAPTSGPMEPGQVIHILSDNADAQCIITAAYGGIDIGTYTFAPNVKQETQTVTETKTETIKPQPDTNSTTTSNTTRPA